jgi:adenylate cyclase, class 2
MHNVEIKAELRDPDLARHILLDLQASKIALIRQTDTYFRVAEGRFKKREAEVDGLREPTEYIHYTRADLPRPRLSHFKIYAEQQAREHFGLLAIGAEARAGLHAPEAAASPSTLPVWVVVRKVRELWMVGNVRVHLDQVESLGTFIELEALVSTTQHVGKCHDAIAELRQHLTPALGELVISSYADMMARHLEHDPRPQLPPPNSPHSPPSPPST